MGLLIKYSVAEPIVEKKKSGGIIYVLLLIILGLSVLVAG